MPIDWGREAMDSERPVPADGRTRRASIGRGKLVRGVTTVVNGGPPEAALAIEAIGLSLERLQKELDTLETRLSPVLMPAPAVNAAGSNATTQAGSPLTQALRTIQRKIDDLTEWMETVRGRLEV